MTDLNTLLMMLILVVDITALRTPPHVKLARGCRYGDFLVMRGDKYIGPSLATQGEWGQGEVEQIFSYFVKPGSTVIDVGANVGAFTVPFAKLAGRNGIVHAIEPIPVISWMHAGTAVNYRWQ